MRLGRLILERYGPFEQLDLPLDPTPGRVNLIVAPNGYGKSVIRRAIGELLFGINGNQMGFRHGTDRMRILADVVEGDTVRSVVRRYGSGNTLAYVDGEDIPAQDARRMFGDVNETTFIELFGLDTALLRTGGDELIKSQGRLGQVLFAASGGMGRVRDMLAEFEKKRDELGRATVRHKSRPIWQALSNWERAGSDLRRAALRPDGWNKLEREANDAAAQLATLTSEQAVGLSERDRLRTMGAIRPWLERLRIAQQVLADDPDTPDLDDSFEQRWRNALAAGATSTSAAKAAEAELLAAQEARVILHFDQVWLDAAAEIEALTELRGRALGAQSDLPGVQAQLAEAQANAARLRRDLGWSDDVELPAIPAVRDAQRLLQKHPSLVAQADSARREQAETARQMAAFEAELAALPDENDVVTIADLVKTLRADGDPPARLEACRRKLRAADAELQSALAAVPDRPLSEAALGTTAAPSDVRLDTADKALDRADTAYVQAMQNRLTRLAELDAEQRKLVALEQSAMLPKPDALHAARAERDALWAGLRALGSTGLEPSSAVALDRAIREADVIANSLIAHGREVAEASVLRDRLTTLEAEVARDESNVTRAAAALAEAQAELMEIAQAAGGDARDMASLRAFLRARGEAILRRGERDAAAAELRDVTQHLAALGLQLATAIDTRAYDVAAIGALLVEADRRIDAARDLAARRDRLARQIETQRKSFATCTSAAAKAEQEMAEWCGQWRGVATALARPEDETPATTADTLTLIDELRTAERDADAAQRRVNDMQSAIALLAERVACLASLAPELTGLSTIEAAETLHRRLLEQRQEAARCNDADRRIEAATIRVATSREAAEASARTLTGLRAALRAGTDEAAEIQLRNVRAVSVARRDRAEAMRELATQGGGMDQNALRARAAETTADEDAARIRVIEARHKELGELIEQARVASGSAATARDQAADWLEAAEAAQRREAAQAMLARTTEEALVLHAARSLLEAALERQASGVEQPLLRRIGEVFCTITGGVQAGVEIEDARDRQTLVAVEADGITRKALRHLSEGTSDQLYLALRIAALEDYATAGASLPFIVDDILQTFDDPRTTAALQALLQLSEKVQVITLTHHPHVGNLAAMLPNGSVNVVRLGD